jgi:hypothetical protein
MFHLNNEAVFNVGVDGTWSEQLTMESTENTKIPFEINRSDVKHQLAYIITRLDGVFDDTRAVTIMHKFRVLNTCCSSVYLRLTNAASVADSFELQPNESSYWSPSISGKVTKGR